MNSWITRGQTSNGLRISGLQYDDHGYIDLEAATREALIESGLAADYMFDQLGERGSRSGSTENGDKFTLRRTPKGLFSLQLQLMEGPKMPFGSRKRDPYDTDISGILERIRVRTPG